MKGFKVGAGLITLALGNSTPIYKSYPGWMEGSNKAGIQIEIYEDYLCSDCKRFNPVFQDLMETKWLDGTVKD